MTCLMSPFAECRSQPAAAVLWSPQAVCPEATVNTAAVRADDATTARNLRRVATTMPPRRPGIDLIEMLAVRETDQNICTLQVIPPPVRRLPVRSSPSGRRDFTFHSGPLPRQVAQLLLPSFDACGIDDDPLV